MRAFCLIREQPSYRREAFVCGLERLGYKVECSVPLQCSPDDVVVVWNRYGTAEHACQVAERGGAKAIVCENGYMGRDWRGGHWYSMSLGQHNGAGEWFPGGPERWDSFGVALEPWRHEGEVVALPQRGVGPVGIAMPNDWVASVQPCLRRLGGRVRSHPGERPAVPLEDDLAKCGLALTWGSGAAIKALAMGIPVAYWFDRWIGGPAARRGKEGIERKKTGDRLTMFRRLAWAMWEVEEIANGDPFRHLLLR